MRMQNFKPAVLTVLVATVLLWGGACLQTWVEASRFGGFSRLPSSYDSGKPLMQVAEEANGKPLLVEFYTDRCVRCNKLVPMVHEFAKMQVASGCVSLALVNAETAENKLFTDLFAVKVVPALFIFNPKKMKKTVVNLPDASKPLPTKEALAIAVKEAYKANSEGNFSRHCMLMGAY
ncbi:MAG: protein disulfide isomerase family protein [Candidatus Melainabacteria bacterium]|nr:protein disulfide isomerase family protein [Candidatus Melainabacteria bacterium]